VKCRMMADVFSASNEDSLAAARLGFTRRLSEASLLPERSMRNAIYGSWNRAVTPFHAQRRAREAAVRRLGPPGRSTPGVHFSSARAGPRVRTRRWTAAERLRHNRILVDRSRGQVPILAVPAATTPPR